MFRHLLVQYWQDFGDLQLCQLMLGRHQSKFMEKKGSKCWLKNINITDWNHFIKAVSPQLLLPWSAIIHGLWLTIILSIIGSVTVSKNNLLRHCWEAPLLGSCVLWFLILFLTLSGSSRLLSKQVRNKLVTSRLLRRSLKRTVFKVFFSEVLRLSCLLTVFKESFSVSLGDTFRSCCKKRKRDLKRLERQVYDFRFRLYFMSTFLISLT